MAKSKKKKNGKRLRAKQPDAHESPGQRATGNSAGSPRRETVEYESEIDASEQIAHGFERTLMSPTEIPDSSSHQAFGFNPSGADPFLLEYIDQVSTNLATAGPSSQDKGKGNETSEQSCSSTPRANNDNTPFSLPTNALPIVSTSSSSSNAVSLSSSNCGNAGVSGKDSPAPLHQQILIVLNQVVPLPPTSSVVSVPRLFQHQGAC